MKKVLFLFPVLVSSFSHAAYFNENFNSIDPAFWYAADGWANSAPFDVGWRGDHANTSGGVLTLNLDSAPCPGGCSGKPYASSNLATVSTYQYGMVYGRFQAAAGSGLITSLFIYAGPDSGSPHDEIDIEILGQDPTKAQFNFFANGSTGNEYVVNLGFDASQGMHDYAFSWSDTGIAWFVDGVLKHSVSVSDVTLPVTAGKVMMNLWAVDASASTWAGNYDGTPVSAHYDYVGFAPNPVSNTVPEPSLLWLLAAGLPWAVWRWRG